ncbi:hypothetical protein PG995_007410 [Apiospora arundinis]|uniref:Integral membrane protein n=1 Tax=Apiospora arundinis TaxID=335852 RepID=A0ABR2JHD3_9PEZI
MDVHDLTRAPPEYLEVVWVTDVCKLVMAVGWLSNYIGMIAKSIKEQTYSMALMPLCCNFAWEFTYFFIYPYKVPMERNIHTLAFLLNCGVMYTAVRYGAREWGHAPLVQRNLPVIFVVCIACWVSAHVAFAEQYGPSLAQAVSGFACQILLSAGGTCQLLCRGHSRGASYKLWLARFMGSFALILPNMLRYKYWRDDHQYIGSPLYIWFLGMFLFLDGSYGFVLWYVRRHEREQALVAKPKVQ